MRSFVWAVAVVIALFVEVAIGLSNAPAGRTVIETTTATTTQTVTATTLSMGAVLVANNGTGKANSQPFTATTASV